MCQGKAEEEDLSALKIASIRWLKHYIKKNKETLITVIRNNTNSTKINRATIKRKQKWEEKQLYGYFKWQTSKISHEKTWTWLRKGNLKRETESLLIAAQNDVIRTNYVKVKKDKTQQISLQKLCCDRWNDQSYNKRMQEISAKRI